MDIAATSSLAHQNVRIADASAALTVGKQAEAQKAEAKAAEASREPDRRTAEDDGQRFLAANGSQQTERHVVGRHVDILV